MTARRMTKKRRKAVFLEHMAKCGVVTRSARKAGIDRTTAYHWRKEDEAFAEAWDTAKNEVWDELEFIVVMDAMGKMDEIEGNPNSDMALRILAKHRFKEWGNVDKHVHAGDDKAPVTIRFGENMMDGLAPKDGDGA